MAFRNRLSLLPALARRIPTRQRWGRRRHRFYRELPRDFDWLEAEVEAHKGDVKTHPPCLLRGLLKVTAGSLWDGVLTDWTREASFMHEYHKWAMDAYTVHVVEAHTFAMPKQLHSQVGGYAITLRDSSMVFQVKPGDLFGMSIAGGSDSSHRGGGAPNHRGGGGAPNTRATRGGDEAPAATVLAAVAAGHESLQAVQVPMCFADMLLAGQWRSLVLLARWKPVLSGFPPASWARLRKGLSEPPQQLPAIAASEFHSLAQRVRTWAPAVLRDAEAEGGLSGWRNAKRALEESVIQLESAARCRETSKPQDGRRKWRTHVLLKAFCAAEMLRAKCTLGDVAKLIWEATFPEHEPPMQFTHLPSPSSIQRTALAVDTALMLTRRRQQATSSIAAVRYGWADASPQGQREWFLSQHTRIEGDLVQLAHAADALWRKAASRRNDADSDNDESDVCFDAPDQACREHLEQLAAQMQGRTQVPMALGLRRASLVQKAAAWLQSVMLECPKEHLDEFLKSIVSFTTDMGTELGMAPFRVSSLAELLPEWLRWPEVVPEDALQADTGVMEDLESLGLHCAEQGMFYKEEDEAEPPELEVALGPAELEAEPFHQELELGAMELQLEAEPLELEPTGVEAPRMEAEPPHHADTAVGMGALALVEVELAKPSELDGSWLVGLMPNAIPIPGVLHTMHNLARDIDEKMSWWPTFFPQLKNLSHFLESRMSRECFIAACLRLSPYSSNEPLWRKLEEASHPSLHEARWGCVISFLRATAPLLPTLRGAWDAAAFEGVRPRPGEAHARKQSPLRCRATCLQAMWTCVWHCMSCLITYQLGLRVAFAMVSTLLGEGDAERHM